MGEEHANRRLAAILAADVVGYSRMMGADEAGTLAALKHHRVTVFDPAVAAHGGRIVKLMGDGTLVEFASVVDAVNCALAIQRAVKAATEPNGHSVVLRIGVNLGDIIIDGDDIYGDGVNVAARLEPLAEPGGICVASIVNESVGNRIDIAFKDGGEVNVKNITRPIRVWKWHPDSDPVTGQPTPPPATGSDSSQLASIAVLPFDNMSDDREQEYFSDGITEDIITDLSKVGGLKVIARNSSFAYKGKTFDIRNVCRELGVTSVLEGSVRRVGNRVRITAQLIDATDGSHLWAERYDRDLTDIFAVQDEVTQNIVTALKVQLTPNEAARITDNRTDSVGAHDLFLRARELLHGAVKNRAMFEEATELFRRAIALDPDYGEPYAGLAMAYNLDFQNGWTETAGQSMDIAVRYADLAIGKGPNDPYCHYIASVVAGFRNDLDRSEAEIGITLQLSPNYALAVNARGVLMIWRGESEAAIPSIEQAVSLDPGYSRMYLHFLGLAHLLTGKYETAIAEFRERIRMVPETDFSRAFLASALGHFGEIDDAKQVWRELKRVNPKYDFAQHLGRLPFRNRADVDRIAEGLGKAGLPN